MTEEKKDVMVKEEMDNKFLKVFGQENYPDNIKEGIDEVMKLVNDNKTIPDLYPEESQEIPVSQSVFQDVCVQINEHYTPHRKMRQILLQLDGKLGALDNAKNKHKNYYVKMKELEEDIEYLKVIYKKLEDNEDLTEDDIFILSSIVYTVEEGENIQTYTILPENISKNIDVENLNSTKLNIIKRKVETALGYKMISYEGAQRGLKSHQHMIKDAAIKCHQLRKQAEKLRKEIEESGLSFDESEVYYYVMYFTHHADFQLRTGDHQVDRGTFMAISQLPGPIRRKVLDNISFLENKMREEVENTGSFYSSDFAIKKYEDILVPKKTGENEIEGLSITDHNAIEPIKIIAKNIE